MNTILSLKNVGVYYGRRTGLFKNEKFWPLKDVSLELYKGETLGIIGRNGAGKTTLLQILAGLIEPDRGIYISNCTSISLLSLNVGFAPHLTGRENAILSGLLLGLRRKQIEKKIDDIIQFSELHESIDQPVKTYSTGMRARLGFSVAFQIDPDVLLIDEVLGVGDIDFRKKSTDAIKKRILSERTIVLVSHNAKTIEELCTRSVILKNGVISAEGKPS